MVRKNGKRTKVRRQNWMCSTFAPITHFTPSFFIGHRQILIQRKKFLGWDAQMSEMQRVDEMRNELEELRALVNTLLTIIMEEADGIQSGSANAVSSLPERGYSM